MKHRRKNAKIKKYDVMIPPMFFEQIAPVLAKNEDAYLLSSIQTVMTGFSSMDVPYVKADFSKVKASKYFRHPDARHKVMGMWIAYHGSIHWISV